MIVVSAWQAVSILFASERKNAVVQTQPIFKIRFVCIIQPRHVFALPQTNQGWEGTSLLEYRRKQTRRWRQGDAEARALPGGD